MNATETKSEIYTTNLTQGLMLAAISVAAFGLTLPMTQLAVAEMAPAMIGFGRSLVAGVIALLLLRVLKVPLPTGRQWRLLAVVAMGNVIGFPLLTAIAMQTVPASHGGVVIALLPLATAICGSLMTAERNKIGFWVCSAAGALVVSGYAISDTDGQLQTGDIWLALAVVIAGISYAMGGKLSREMPGWQVICWALVLSLPVTATVSLYDYQAWWTIESAVTWGSFLYLALVSQLGGFFLWNKALAVGGVTRASQVQLLQPTVTLAASALLLGEVVPTSTWGVALVVAALVALGLRLR